jgi:hypothetical protein
LTTIADWHTESESLWPIFQSDLEWPQVNFDIN